MESATKEINSSHVAGFPIPGMPAFFTRSSTQRPFSKCARALRKLVPPASITATYSFSGMFPVVFR